MEIIAINNNHNHTNNSFFEMNITISTRLAAMLTLKAMISRKWKDRGRSGGGINKKLSSLLLLNEQVKDRIRIDILSIVTQPNHTSNSIVFDDNSVMTLMIKDKQIQVLCIMLLVKASNKSYLFHFSHSYTFCVSYFHSLIVIMFRPKLLLFFPKLLDSIYLYPSKT